MVEPATLTLSGCHVISLRPLGAHAPLRRAARRHGAGVVALSGLRIDLLDDAATTTALAVALQATKVVVTSPNAVRAAHALQPLPLREGQDWFAVGSGTAAALRRAGIDEVQAPTRMDSEGLLALPGLQDLQGQALALLTAPGGRGLLQPALAARGARVKRVDLYRRTATTPAAMAVRRLLACPADRMWLALSSAEALDSVLQRLPASAAAHLRSARVAAASTRLAEHARSQGFGSVVLATGPRPAQLLAAMAQAHNRA